MNVVAKPLPRMTADAFYELTDLGPVEGKVELVDGRIRMQHYASDAHGTIQANFAGLIRNHLIAKRPGCRVVTEGGVQTRLNAKHNVRRPDVTVTCSPPAQGQRAVPNPVLIVQVMSPNNVEEQWESIRALAHVISIREIVVAESETVEVQVFRRQTDNNWPAEPERVGPGGTVRLASLDLDIAVADLYWGTALA